MFRYLQKIFLIFAITGVCWFFLQTHALSSSFSAIQTVASMTGVVEVKASKTLQVNSLPANGATVTIGSCVITFVTVSWETLDDLDCSDNIAAIDRNTGTGNNSRLATTIGWRLRALTNVTDSLHGWLMEYWWSWSFVVFNTSGVEISVSDINFVDGSDGDIFSIANTPGVIWVSPIAQVVTFTPLLVTSGELFLVSINNSEYSITGTNGTVWEILSLATLIDADPVVDCSENGVKITCIASSTWVSFTFSASVIDVTKPHITLVGSGTETVAFGSLYSDQWATWTDNVDGDGSVIAYTGTVDTNILATFVLSYRYIDVAGNEGMTITRFVTVTDQTWPTITLSGWDMDIDQFTDFVDPGANWVDAVDGTGLVYASSGMVNTGIAWVYSIEYRKVDAAWNTGNTVTRTVRVLDKELPVVLLSGGDITIEYGSDFVDPGANRTDNVDGSGFILASDGMVDTWTVGWYKLEYRYTDTGANTSNAVKRIVYVVDTTKPVLTLNGGNETIEQYSDWTDLGANWIDTVDGTGIVYGSSWNVNTGVLWTYMVEYVYVDTAGNTGETVTRMVTVVLPPDTTPPIITLVWPTDFSVYQYGTYTELWALWNDERDGSGTITIPSSGTVDISTTGTYEVKYWYVDMAGNTGNTVIRTVQVLEIPPVVVDWVCGMSYGSCVTGTVIAGIDNMCGADDSRSCNGSNGGENITCSARNAACPSQAVTGICGISYGSCVTWTVVSGIDNICGADDSWSCNGSNGGENVTCSARNAVCPIYTTWTNATWINTGSIPSAGSSHTNSPWWWSYWTIIPVITMLLTNTWSTPVASWSVWPICESSEYSKSRYDLLIKLAPSMYYVPVSKKTYITKAVTRVVKRIEKKILSSSNQKNTIEMIVCRILSLKETAKKTDNKKLLYVLQYIEDRVILLYQ